MLLRILMFAAASFLILIFSGCSTDFDAENQTSGSGTTWNYQSIGASTCISCHTGIAATAGMGVSDYLAGMHVIHSLNITASSSDSCLSCHDPLGDGISLEPSIAPADVPVGGLAAVTCETCHGGGGEHFGNPSTQVPYVSPDHKRCALCHDATDNTFSSYHSAEADNISTKFEGSPHFKGLSAINTAPCNACHSDEGAKANKNDTYNATPAWLDANITAITTASSIQCRTCHSAHSLELLRITDVTGSAEYNTCTNCHQAANAYHGETPGTGIVLPGLYFDRIIYDTHVNDDDTTIDIIEGYIFNPDNERICRNCHDVHEADVTRNKQWARSAHAGHIGELKEAQQGSGLAAVQAAAVQKYTAWSHYDWDDTTGVGPGGRARSACQRCHTATGAKNYLTAMKNGTTYSPSNNDYGHLTGWTANGYSGQNELLYCWGCHSNNAGGLNNPGAVTLEYTVNSVNPTLTDLGKSNVCVPCHAGRGNMDSYGLTGDPSTAMSAGSSTIMPSKAHEFTAAAMIYQAKGPSKIGYEYANQDYSDQSYYHHYEIGLNHTSPETGTGPCVGCHMTDNDHSLPLVEKVGDVITNLNATICVTCHDGARPPYLPWAANDAAVAAAIEEGREGFEEALTLLVDRLQLRGIQQLGFYPYWNAPTWVDEGTFGAMHNLLTLDAEPGAYAHNSYYAKRLIYDSLDWLDNKVTDGGVDWVQGSYPLAFDWMKNRSGVIARP